MWKICRVLVAAVLLLVGWPMVSGTDLSAQGVAGIRGGVSSDPDQVYGGAHLNLGPVADHFWFRPNLEAGFGDRRTLIALNGEFVYWIDPPGWGWDVYFGGGPAVNFINFDDDFRGEGTRVEPGFNLLLGVGFGAGFFGELKVGAWDSPELKLGLGFSFP